MWYKRLDTQQGESDLTQNNQNGEGKLATIGTIVAIVLAVAGGLYGAQRYVAKEISAHARPDNGIHHLSEEQIQKLVEAEVKKHLKNAPASDSIPSGAVVAFADTPTGALRHDCQSLPGDWDFFPIADGRFILGAGQLGEERYSAGETGGEPTVVLSVEEMPRHTHRLGYGPWGLANGKGQGNLETTGGSINLDPTGGNKPHNNMPPYVTLTFCKKV